MEKNVVSKFRAEVRGALEKAKKQGEKVYQDIGKSFLVNITVPKRSPHSHFTTVELAGFKLVRYYQTGFKGRDTYILNLNLFGVEQHDLGKDRLFVCQLEVVALPDGRWFLGVKAIKKGNADYAKPFLVVDPQLAASSEERTIKTFEAISRGVKSPLVKIHWTRNQWKRMQGDGAAA